MYKNLKFVLFLIENENDCEEENYKEGSSFM